MTNSIPSVFTDKDISRFWAKVEKSSGCWNWQSAKNDSGYGIFWYLGRQRGAHRISYEMTYGDIGNGICVLHKCDNRLCVRPDHLFLGTNADNVADRDAKGRQVTPCKDSHWNAKLTSAAVATIRSEYAQGGVSYRQLAKRFNVDKSAIGHIVRGRLWK